MDETAGFSPVKIAASAGLGRVGNLTGYPRRVKDGVAECYQYYQQWIQINNRGTAIITRIANIKLNSEEETSWKQDEHEQLEELCENLLNVCLELKEVQGKMCALRKQFECLKELTSDVLFLSWPISKFCDTVNVFEESMRRECVLRCRLLELVAHTTNKHHHILYYTAWTHSPYTHTTLHHLIHAMLTETGHL